MATLRIEYVSNDGHLCSVEHEAAELMHANAFTVQVHLSRLACQMLPELSEDIACGQGQKDCRGILGSK
jgi:hypothetical protein